MSENSQDPIKFIKEFGAIPEAPKVSVIIITWNRDKELLECLNGLSNQNEKNFETIIGNNGNYNSLNFKKKDIRLIQLKENHRPSFARNICLGFARSNIVAFLDDDAIPNKEWIENILSSFDKNKIIALRGKIIPKNRLNIYSLTAGHYNLGSKIIPSFIDLEGNCAFSRKRLLEVNGFDPDIFGFEGIELTYRMIGKGDMDLSIYDPSVVVYHDGSDSFLRSMSKSIRHSRNYTILKRKNPGLYEFISEYQDMQTCHEERHANIKLSLMLKFKILLLKVSGLICNKLGVFIALFSSRLK